MKKVLLLIMALATVLSFVACKGTDNQKDDTNSGNLEGSLEEILDKIYDTADVDDNFKEYV
ncbi:MAG: hypothetical protein GX915_08385, partial [Clostridiales bacterium]|nr:hypothetical protein [Clostridiales bacterium]